MPSKVYFIETKDRESTESVSKKLEFLIDKSRLFDTVEKSDFIGMKLHFGDKGNLGYIRSEWAKVVVDKLTNKSDNVFLVDTNVLYKNSQRTNSVDHLKIAYEHGFGMEKVGAPVIIADGLFGRNYIEVKIEKKHFKTVKIAPDVVSCDRLAVLTHVTGHIQTGLAAALKNIGMGCASRRGKYEQHSGIVPDIEQKFCTGCGFCLSHCPSSAIVMEKGKARILEESCIGCGECILVCRTKAIETKWSETLENLQEKMVEYAYGVIKTLKGKLVYINFLIRVTKDCDCLATDEPSIAKDIGILASHDPVSIDKASCDLLLERNSKDVFREGYPEIDWTVQLKYASTIGLGDLNYKIERV